MHALQSFFVSFQKEHLSRRCCQNLCSSIISIVPWRRWSAVACKNFVMRCRLIAGPSVIWYASIEGDVRLCTERIESGVLSHSLFPNTLKPSAQSSRGPLYRSIEMWSAAFSHAPITLRTIHRESRNPICVSIQF